MKTLGELEEDVSRLRTLLAARDIVITQRDEEIARNQSMAGRAHKQALDEIKALKAELAAARASEAEFNGKLAIRSSAMTPELSEALEERGMVMREGKIMRKDVWEELVALRREAESPESALREALRLLECARDSLSFTGQNKLWCDIDAFLVRTRKDGAPSLTLIAMQNAFEAHNRNAGLAQEITRLKGELAQTLQTQSHIAEAHRRDLDDNAALRKKIWDLKDELLTVKTRLANTAYQLERALAGAPQLSTRQSQPEEQR